MHKMNSFCYFDKELKTGLLPAFACFSPPPTCRRPPVAAAAATTIIQYELLLVLLFISVSVSVISVIVIYIHIIIIINISSININDIIVIIRARSSRAPGEEGLPQSVVGRDPPRRSFCLLLFLFVVFVCFCLFFVYCG